MRYPFYVGPSYEGKLEGILIPPAKVFGLFLPSGLPVNQEVAGVEITINAGEISTSLRTNTLPYKIKANKSRGKL